MRLNQEVTVFATGCTIQPPVKLCCHLERRRSLMVAPSAVLGFCIVITTSCIGLKKSFHRFTPFQRLQIRDIKPSRVSSLTHQMSEWDAENGVWIGDKAISDETLPSPLYLFGYGSLLWNPGDLLRDFNSYSCGCSGWERLFAQRSMDHRGSVLFPGFVATLVESSSFNSILMNSNPIPNSNPSPNSNSNPQSESNSNSGSSSRCNDIKNTYDDVLRTKLSNTIEITQNKDLFTTTISSEYDENIISKKGNTSSSSVTVSSSSEITTTTTTTSSSSSSSPNTDSSSSSVVKQISGISSSSSSSNSSSGISSSSRPGISSGSNINICSGLVWHIPKDKVQETISELDYRERGGYHR